jgi:prepilin signal peptidase PulO-like enzyme (type II secretory pathway)
MPHSNYLHAFTYQALWLDPVTHHFMLSILLFTLAGLLLGGITTSFVQRLAHQMTEDADEFARDRLGLPNAVSTAKSAASQATGPAWFRHVPLVVGGVIGVACGMYPGTLWQDYALFTAAFLLLWLVAVDFKTMYLPDSLNYGLAGIGILAGALGWFVTPENALWGILAGYLSLYVPAVIFQKVRGVQGLGEGDCLLLAGMGGYIGPMAIVPLLLIASFVAIIGHFATGNKRENPFPFGPALALAGVLTFIIIRVPALQPGVLQAFFQ